MNKLPPTKPLGMPSSSVRTRAASTSTLYGAAAASSNSNPDSSATSTTNRPSVAIIGGGIAGLSCAAALQQQQQQCGYYDVTVYDTGRLRPGGRASSRQPHDPPKTEDVSNSNGNDNSILSNFRYDHAAQFISTTSSASTSSSSAWRNDFDHQLQQWFDQGILQAVPADGMFVLEPTKNGSCWKQTSLNPYNKVSDDSSSTTTTTTQFYYPTQGMSSLPQELMKEGSFRVEQDVWVSPSSGVRYVSSSQKQDTDNHNDIDIVPAVASDQKWQVRAQGKILGEYTHLVIAHNGKCADRLMSNTPAKEVHRLLRVNFSDRLPSSNGGGGAKMTLNSLYSLTVALKAPSSLSRALPKSLVGGFVQGHAKVSMISCQTQKYPPSSYHNESGNDNIEVWNILSTATFAKKHKAPQEFLPDDVVTNVTQQLLEAVDEILMSGSNNNSDGERVVPLLMDQVVDSRVQLWGAAVPMNVWNGGKDTATSGGGGGFIYDPQFQVGVCGDWLMEPSIAGAWTSGRHLARHLKSVSKETAAPKQQSSIGLNGRFEASPGVRKLGIASLDGPMNRKDDTDNRSAAPRVRDNNNISNTSKPRKNPSSNKTNNNRRNGNGGSRPRKAPSNENQQRAPVATIDSSSS